MEAEIWKDIKCYEGLYQASNLGRIKRLKTSYLRTDGSLLNLKEKVVKNVLLKNGYMKVTLCNGVACTQFYVHRLIAGTFIDNLDNNPEVNHKDGNKCNNSVGNLEWCNRSANIVHSFKIGLRETGDSHHLSKITFATAEKIREFLSKGGKTSILKNVLHISDTTISKIKNNKSWIMALNQIEQLKSLNLLKTE